MISYSETILPNTSPRPDSHGKNCTESPGKYESYVDLVPGQWTHVKITVAGTTARLYVNGSDQPTLMVNDLKQPPAKGAIALWTGPGTIAHFSDLKVTP